MPLSTLIRLLVASTLISSLPIKVAAEASHHGHPAWMVGTWDFRSANAGPRTNDCKIGTDQVAYSARGYWVGIAVGDYGRWWIKKDRLFELTINPGDGGSASDKRTITKIKFRRVSAVELEVKDRTKLARLVRCDRKPSIWFARGVKH